MAKRKGISKKTRFEVFKRDSFTCQYCGRPAPEVILHVDHIQPVSKDGENDILNLITSCVECNAGKSDRLLTDNTTLQKQKAQLDELNERREQLEMMIQWRQGLRGLDETAVEAASEEWSSLVGGYSLNERGLLDLKKLINKFGLQAVLDAIGKTVKYLQVDSEGGYTQESVEEAWKKVGGICQISTLPEWKQQLYHVRNIARSKMYYGCSNSAAADVLRLFEEAYNAGWSIEQLKEIALEGHSYSALCGQLQEHIDYANAQSKKHKA